MKRKLLLSVLLSLVPFQTQASVDGNADGKDVAIVVLACGTAFMSGAWLVWCWYTRSVKRELQYNLAHAQGELGRTQGQLRGAEDRLQQLAQAIGPVVEDTRRTNRAVGDAQTRIQAVRDAALAQLQRATAAGSADEVWITMQNGGPPPSYNAPHVSLAQLLPPALQSGVTETDLRQGPAYQQEGFGDEQEQVDGVQGRIGGAAGFNDEEA